MPVSNNLVADVTSDKIDTKHKSQMVKAMNQQYELRKLKD